MSYAGVADPAYATALAGLIVAHVCHLFSVLVLYRLSSLVLPPLSNSGHPCMPLVAAGLHVISPAGIFLSAPNSESLFSFLNFSGFCLYAESAMEHPKGKFSLGSCKLLASGLVIAMATMVRSNGLLSGLIFAYDATCRLGTLYHSAQPFGKLLGVIPTLVAGSLIGVGFFVPQYVAWLEYCTNNSPAETLRPWCKKCVPSIYAWVQSHYW